MTNHPQRPRDPNQLAKSIVHCDGSAPMHLAGLSRFSASMLEKWELANYKPQHNFVVRRYMIGKGHSVSVLRRGGEADTIFGFEKEADALEWIREKSQAWLLGQQMMSWRFLSDACNTLNWLWAQINFGRK